MCPQDGEGPQSEDCLFLNVWTPINATKQPPYKKLAVNVYLHGGGYQTGSGGDDTFNGCAQAQDGKVVVVTINYRLGVLGFLATPGLKDPNGGNTVGNWGMLDQRVALRWVRDNIHAFGGDNTRVMLYGESAGAYSTLLHVVSPGSRGLFSRAMTFSGSTDVMAVDFPADAFAKAVRVQELLHCTDAESEKRGFPNPIDCLRATPLKKVLAAQKGLLQAAVDEVHSCIPVIDGVVLPEHPHILMKKGRANPVPVVLGTNAREGALEVIGQTGANFNLTVWEFFGALNNLAPIDPSFFMRIYQQYEPANWGGLWLLSAFFAVSDAAYHCPTRRAAELFAKQGLPTRYFMLQTAKPNSGCALSATSGGKKLPKEAVDFMDAYHSYDVPFTAMVPYRKPYSQKCNWTEEERQLSSFLAGIVAAHTATGSPLPARSASLKDPRLRALTESAWPTWSNVSRPVFNIDVAEGPSLVEARDLLDAKCKLWDDLLEFNIARQTLWDNELPSPAP